MKKFLFVLALLLVAGAFMAVVLSSKDSRPLDTQADSTVQENTDNTTEVLAGECGHNIDTTIVSFGYNLVVDSSGDVVSPQGKPIQEGYNLIESSEYVDEHNTREYARIFSYMAQIRDALICEIESLDEETWTDLTQILVLNNIKVEQDLSGTPKEQVYSSNGIYEHLKTNGEDFHPMMKYLEEAELELKCLAFRDFDFTNPEGENHCQIQNLDVGSGLTLP